MVMFPYINLWNKLENRFWSEINDRSPKSHIFLSDSTTSIPKIIIFQGIYSVKKGIFTSVSEIYISSKIILVLIT